MSSDNYGDSQGESGLESHRSDPDDPDHPERFLKSMVRNKTHR